MMVMATKQVKVMREYSRVWNQLTGQPPKTISLIDDIRNDGGGDSIAAY
jgi:hypothetical protein